jgi:HlyD family secretion protein
VRQADAALERAKLSIATQEAALRKARSALAAAEATVSRVRATEALTRLNRERWRRLYAEGLVARADVDARETEASAAAEDLKNVIAQREAAVEEVALLQASLEASRQDIRVAAAALNTVTARQADTVVTSPLDGFVVSRELEPGATVNPGTPILRIADPRTVWVTVHVDERSSGAIAVGDRAEISLRSGEGRPLKGHVSRIRRESDRVTEQLAVDVSFVERPARLTLGEQAEATIRSAARRTGPAFPLAALVRAPDGPAALVVKDGRIEFRRVKVGISDPAGWVEALEGIRPGELVVVTPGRLADRSSEGIRVVATRIDAKLSDTYR